MAAKTLYLESQMIWGGLFVLFYCLSGKSRKIILLGALAAIPLGFINYAFGEVWNPGRVMEGSIGMEDFLFCFLSGGLSLVLVNWVIDFSRTSFRFYFRWRRWVLTSFWGFGILISLFLLGIKDYLNSYLCMVLTAILLIALERPLWKVFVSGAFLYIILYFAGLKLGLLIWPDLIHLWNLENMTGMLIGKVPLDEMIWAFLFGGTWPAVFLYVSGPEAADLKWRKFLLPAHR